MLTYCRSNDLVLPTTQHLMGCHFDAFRQCNPEVGKKKSVWRQWHADANATLTIRGRAAGDQATLDCAMLDAAKIPEVYFSD